MRDKPEGSELLAIAGAALREEVLPGLGGRQRYTLLMALNAMGIAQRQLEYGQGLLDEEWASLAGLLELPVTPGDLSLANGQLAKYIRAGQYDKGTKSYPLLRAHLWRSVVNRVRESSPRRLVQST